MTLHRAKPLVPVLCTPILGHILESLEANGIFRAAANVWYRKEDLLAYGETLAEIPVRFSLVPEKRLLGTGGGIANVAAKLNPSGPVLVHNGDIYTNADLSAAIREHRLSGALLTLLVREGNPEVTTVRDEVVDIANRLGTQGECTQKFSGISVWEPDAFKYLPQPGEPGDAIDAIVSILKDRPGSIRTYDIGNALWSDIGTPNEYLELHRKLIGNQVHLSEGIALPMGVQIEGFLCTCSGSKIGAGCRLKDVVVWPESEIAPGSQLERAIVGPFGVSRV